MKKTIFIFVAIILLGFAGYAFAHPGEQTITCSNMCIYTLNSNGTLSIQDCCGGRINLNIVHVPHEAATIAPYGPN